MGAPAKKLEPTPPSAITPHSNITDFGRRIFRLIGEKQPSTFNKNYWSGRIMEWSMRRPDFKLNMFRLVDVLPTLRDSASIARHVSEYLAPIGSDLYRPLGWALDINPHSLRAKIMAFIVQRVVGQMASQFIAGSSPQEALKPLRASRRRGQAFTVDLLGEYSVSEVEALRYLERYLEALEVLRLATPEWDERAPLIPGHPGDLSPVCVSVKLSALYSQCHILNFERSVAVLSERLAAIARKAQQAAATLYVDAEDSGTNPMIYEAFCRVFSSPEFAAFPYPGIVVQAYAKEARQVIDKLLRFAAARGPIAIRLVKGAYWDHETILSTQNDWPSPLFSFKQSSDANYELLTQLLLDNHAIVLPAFGSHNVRSLSHACCYAERLGLDRTKFELQMLYGMADPIAAAFQSLGYLVRLYVPLGEILPGMGYLVRRLLENTSNESFLRHTFFDSAEIDNLLSAPQFQENL
ncbi:MAG: proline dehydrogenase family protein [Oligoflexia bacterium]|nr:proline dehydrogenase family protein [Oligoflexia bacterium]